MYEEYLIFSEWSYTFLKTMNNTGTIAKKAFSN